MAVQNRNDDLMNFIRGEFQARYEQAFHWSQAVSTYLALPALRGFWPMSSVAYTNPQGLDESGNVNHLTNNNTSTFGYTNLIPHVTFNGTTQYLSKADGGAVNWADVTGGELYVDSADRGLTFGGWYKFDALDVTTESLISKWGAAGQRSYIINRPSFGTTVQVAISVDGTAATVVANTTTLDTTSWWFIVGRFIPSTDLSLFVNSVKATLGVGIPATIFDSTATFMIGDLVGTTQPFDGKASMCFLCAAQLSDSIISALFNQTRSLFNV